MRRNSYRKKKTGKYIVVPTLILALIVSLALIQKFRSCAIASDETEIVQETKTYSFPVIEIVTPNMATLDGYMQAEKVFEKISRDQISKILRDLNGECFPVNTSVASTSTSVNGQESSSNLVSGRFYCGGLLVDESIVTHVTNGKVSGYSQSTSISFREGKKVFLIDFNGNFKALGVKGKTVKSIMLDLPAAEE